MLNTTASTSGFFNHINAYLRFALYHSWPASRVAPDKNRERHAEASGFRELESGKRTMRGLAACAECKRLKLKCDKQIPCSTCIHRNCSIICPNGTMAPGRRGPRMELTDTEKLNSKLIQMSKRVRQLEDALKIAQSSISLTPHPALSVELMAIKTGLMSPDKSENFNLVPDAFASSGTLTTALGGESRFVGRCGSEALVLSNEDIIIPRAAARGANPATIAGLPEEIMHLSETFPLCPENMEKANAEATIRSYLPSRQRATALITTYLEIIAWHFKPIDNGQILEELFPRFYYDTLDPAPQRPAGPKVDLVIPEHELSLLFTVFACGAVAESSLNPSSDEAEQYSHLARAALSLISVFQHTSLSCIQAISMMGAYGLFSCRTNNFGMSWKLLSFALCLASSIGLHRDPGRRNLSKKLIQRRRCLFWELWTLDNGKSTISGRPAVFRMQNVDCEYPEDTDAHIAEDGTTKVGFLRWKYMFGKEIVSAIVETFCAARPIKYSEILDLDKRIREHTVYPPNQSSRDLRQHDVTKHSVVVLFKELSILFIHRNFFARVMRESPDNPLRSPFAQSFLIAYASAVSFLRYVRNELGRPSHPYLRCWPLWMHAFSAGIVVGIVAVRGMSLALAISAFRELELAISLFGKAKPHPVAKNGLPTLQKLRGKAISQLRFRCKSGTGSIRNPASPSTNEESLVTKEDIEDELLILSADTTSTGRDRSLGGEPLASGTYSTMRKQNPFDDRAYQPETLYKVDRLPTFTQIVSSQEHSEVQFLSSTSHTLNFPGANQSLVREAIISQEHGDGELLDGRNTYPIPRGEPISQGAVEKPCVVGNTGEAIRDDILQRIPEHYTDTSHTIGSTPPYWITKHLETTTARVGLSQDHVSGTEHGCDFNGSAVAAPKACDDTEMYTLELPSSFHAGDLTTNMKDVASEINPALFSIDLGSNCDDDKFMNALLAFQMEDDDNALAEAWRFVTEDSVV